MRTNLSHITQDGTFGRHGGANRALFVNTQVQLIVIKPCGATTVSVCQSAQSLWISHSVSVCQSAVVSSIRPCGSVTQFQSVRVR